MPLRGSQQRNVQEEGVIRTRRYYEIQYTHKTICYKLIILPNNYLIIPLENGVFSLESRLFKLEKVVINCLE